MNIFISGINSCCGKTLIASALAAVLQSLGYKTGVYKPIQTSAIDKGNFLLSPDLEFVKNLDPHIITHATYLLTSNATPFAASNIENVNISISDIENDYNIISHNTEFLFVESTGGLFTPITSNVFSYHIPLTLKIPVIFIVTPSNDSLNTLLTELNTAKNAGLQVIGIIINKYPMITNNIELISFSSVFRSCCNYKILGTIREFKNKPIKTDELFSEILTQLNIEDIMEIKIPKLNPDY